MATIGAITSTTFGPFLVPSITGRAVRTLVHIRFPVARDLRFIARTLKIWEQMGLATVEKNGSVVRVMRSMMPTLYLRNIPSVGSVQILVGIIREVEYIENALKIIAQGIKQ